MLVDDDPLVRTGLRLLLDSTDDLTVIAEAGDGDEAITAQTATPADVVLMDLRMPRMDGLTAIRLLRALPHPPEVVALTTWDVDDAVVGALEAGAAGFLLKTASPAEILGAIRATLAGDAVISPRSTRQLIDHLAHDSTTEHHVAARNAVGRLTDREQAVAAAVGRGLTNQEIGVELFMAPSTAKTHVSTIQTKLGVANRVGIAVVAERAGLLRTAG